MNSSANQENKRILIVDDEADVLEFLNIYLGSLGWEIFKAASTTKAFELLKEHSFFLILSDIAMPEMDGYELIHELREQNIRSQVALMTGFGYNPRHTLVKINKTVRYPTIFKPFDRAKLSELVKNAHTAYHADINGNTP